MTNIKDTLTTICGFIFGIATAVLTYQQSTGIAFPEWLTVALGIAITISGFVIFYFTGKNPDGSTKTVTQVQDQLSKK